MQNQEREDENPVHRAEEEVGLFDQTDSKQRSRHRKYIIDGAGLFLLLLLGTLKLKYGSLKAGRLHVGNADTRYVA